MHILSSALIIFCVFLKSFGISAHESFADLVEDLIPSVVSIASKTIVKEQLRQPIPQFPEGSPFDDFFKDFFDYEQQKPSQRPLIGLGSGFIIHESGIVVTNNHVIEGADEITIIMSDKTEFTAELLGRDPKSDLAVLKFDPKEKELSSVSWGDSDIARVGDQTIAIGNPLGLGGTVTAGIISAISRDIGNGPYVQFIQTDASINRGNSGGPLFDIKGEVIGINTAIISQTGGSIGLGFAVDGQYVQDILKRLMGGDKIKWSYIGISYRLLDRKETKSNNLDFGENVIIMNVDKKGAAHNKLFVGDIVQKLDGECQSQSIGHYFLKLIQQALGKNKYLDLFLLLRAQEIFPFHQELKPNRHFLYLYQQC